MRGVYGKNRGILIGVDGSVRQASLPSTSSMLEQAKVAAVITLSAVAVLVGVKVLSPDAHRRRSY